MGAAENDPTCRRKIMIRIAVFGAVVTALLEIARILFG